MPAKFDVKKEGMVVVVVVEKRGWCWRGVDKENATRWKAAADGWETLL